MSDISIIDYTSEFSTQWDDMVRRSRNGTFLLERQYMDYHSARFEDCSLIALRAGKPIALLPLCRTERGVSSHAGLTYGGWITPPTHFDGSVMLDIFHAWIEKEKARGTQEIIYKPVPEIFARTPAQEDLYALWRSGFSLKHRLLSSAVDLREPWKFDMSKRQQVRKAEKLSPLIEESTDYVGFWRLLCECLKERHEARPVHSLAEIQLLHSRFPRNIRLFTAKLEGEIHAGVVIYDTGLVAHSQYAATSAFGRKNYLLTAIYHRLMSEIFASHRWMDFGTSNEQGGRVLNCGLLAQKASMGGGGIAYDTYFLKLPD